MLHRFDDFEIDMEKFELRQNGEVRKVEPLVFDLICFLAENQSRVVSRDEIIDHVWKGRIVSDATIASGIKSARKALGDSGTSQNYIRTVRGRGFQFMGTLEPATVTGNNDPEPKWNSSTSATEPQIEQPVIDGRPSRDTNMPMLAVLPFVNLSAEADEYFADGLTEDIITSLSRFRDLRVVGRTSTFQFKGQSVDLSEIRARLKVGYAVEGSVRRAAGRVRISAQLIDTATGVHLWADNFDQDMEDIFTVQDEVTRMITAKLGVKIQDVATRRALKKGTAELDAYDCVLRARRYTSLLSEESHAEARDLLEQAIILDPAYAEAHVLLANIYLAEYRFDANPRPDPIGRAKEMAEKAVSLDPQSAYAHCWLGIVHFFRRENEKFEAEAERALSLNPNDPETLADIGHFLAFMGNFERGLELSLRARQLNPLHPGWYYFTSARYHYDKRAYKEALADVERVSMPDFYWTHLLNAAALGQLGNTDASISLERIYKIKKDFSAREELTKWNAAPDDFEHLMDGLTKAGLKE